MRKSDRYSQRAEARLELLPDPRYGDQFADDEEFDSSQPDTEGPTSASQEFYRPQRVPSPPRRSTEDFNEPYATPRTPRPRPPQEDPDQFLRVPRRVAVRRGRLPESITGRILFGLTTLLAILAIAALAWAIGHYLLHDDHFVLASSDAINISGEQHISHQQLMDAFSHDVGHNVFTIPLSQRRATLESNPWVAHATVSRLLPNRLRVTIAERKPVAFTRDGNNIGLVDATGVIMNLPRGSDSGTQLAAWSLPVVIGITSDLPLSTRTARMLIFNRFVADIDSAGPPLSRKLSEVDLTDPDDVKALVPEDGMDVLVHFGSTGFLSRFQNFEQHLPEWRQLYPHLYSADMRYDRQVVLDMSPGTAVPTTAAPATQATPITPAVATPPAQTAPATVTPVQTKPVPTKIAAPKVIQTKSIETKPVQTAPAQHPAPQQTTPPPTQQTKPSAVVTQPAPLNTKPSSAKPSAAHTAIGLPITPLPQTTAPAKPPATTTKPQSQKPQTNSAQTKPAQTKPAETKPAQNNTAYTSKPQSKLKPQANKKPTTKAKLKPASAHKPAAKPASKPAAKTTHAPTKKPSTKSHNTNEDAPMVLPSIHSTGKPAASHAFVPAPVSTGGLQ